MVIDRTQFERRVKSKLISKQQKGNLIIYNYTNDCAWNKQWDRYTLMARGLIVTTTGKVIARPFPKFFNLDETEQTSLKNLPNYHPEIVEKMDGSLGILYRDQDATEIGDIAIATRGSFTSDQALWATRWIQEHRPKNELQDHITYLFEIIYPENRIVVDYGNFSGLVLIGLVHNYTGKIFEHAVVEQEAKRLGYDCAKQHHISLATAKQYTESSMENEEGYVIFYPAEQLLLKLKLKDYVRLHRLMFGISVKSIWENMAWGQNPLEIFSEAPDEVMDWIKTWTKKFNDESGAIIDRAARHLGVIKGMETRKDKALYLKEHCPDLMSIVLGMLDGKQWRPMVYKLIKPPVEESNKSFRIVKTAEVV